MPFEKAYPCHIFKLAQLTRDGSSRPASAGVQVRATALVTADSLSINTGVTEQRPAAARGKEAQEKEKRSGQRSSLEPTEVTRISQFNGVVATEYPPEMSRRLSHSGACLSALIEKKDLECGPLPLYSRLQMALQWWNRHASWEVCQILSQGLQPNWKTPPSLSVRKHVRSLDQTSLAQKILADYSLSGAVKKVPFAGTMHLIPWFVLSKPEGDSLKHRLISDCREINQYLVCKKFRLENLSSILPYLKKGHFAAKIDLKDAYFHVPLGESFKPFLRMQVGEDIWEFQAGCFGLNLMPQVFMAIMRTFEKRWRGRGIICFVYLDDILLLGPTAQRVQEHLQVLIGDLLDAGFKINRKKSVLYPVQSILHLGFTLNLEKGELQLCPQRLKTVRKELGKLVVATSMSVRKMAAILGQVRSFLVALPFLRSFTDTMCAFIKTHTPAGWDSVHRVPPFVKSQLREIKHLLNSWSGRPFYTPPSRQLYADSSTYAWAGLDPVSKSFVQEFWRDKVHWHINVKELSAAIQTVQSLANPGETVLLSVDNQVSFWYLTKGGGRHSHFNALLRPFINWCIRHKVTLQVRWVPSKDMLADNLSRWDWDPGDYTLSEPLFQFLRKVYLPWGGSTPTCLPPRGTGNYPNSFPGGPIGKRPRWTLCSAPWTTWGAFTQTPLGTWSRSGFCA